MSKNKTSLFEKEAISIWKKSQLSVAHAEKITSDGKTSHLEIEIEKNELI